MMYYSAYLELVEREKARQDIERAKEAERALVGATNHVLGKRAGGPRGRLRGSVPGSPPMMRSGALRGSVKPVVTPGDILGADIEAGAGYAGYLESGTGKMAARPFRERILGLAGPKLIEINGRAYRLPMEPKGMVRGNLNRTGR